MDELVSSDDMRVPYISQCPLKANRKRLKAGVLQEFRQSMIKEL